MPETPESQPDHVRVFETFLNASAAGDPGLTVQDLDTMIIVLTIRLRSVFTADELHTRLHFLITQGEEWLAEPGALRDDHDQPVDAVLVENFEDREDLLEMMKESTQEITQGDLNSLLNEEAE